MLSGDGTGRYSTADVARRAGVHKDTLLRWLRGGLVSEPKRDRHGWRFFTPAEADAVITFAKTSTDISVAHIAEEKHAPYLERLKAIDWNFADAKTAYLTHGIHPYPAKFIPQIPNALIQELSSVGDTVADIFCGSGTTLVEALTLKRHAVGLDANPLACLISEAKTNSISEEDVRLLHSLRDQTAALGEELRINRQDSLLPSSDFESTGWRPSYKKLDFWFAPHVIEELAEVRKLCLSLPSEAARKIALVSFSSIVVSVSRQDSDTRYVRREKSIEVGDVLKRFSRALDQATKTAVEFSELVESRFRCAILEADLLSDPVIPSVDLVVCSPPYPNAYSYHLYHMTRMLWLEMDQPLFKRKEIGSHRKYSSKSKNAATVETFRTEFQRILEWLSRYLAVGRYACFVVGNSTLRGQRVNNAELISNVARECGAYVEVARISRTMQTTKKAFNPAIGKIKEEDILILERR